MHRVAAATLVILCICNTNRKKKKVVLSLNIARNWNVRWQVTWYSFICYLGAFSFSSIILSLSLSLFLYMYIYIYIYRYMCAIVLFEIEILLWNLSNICFGANIVHNSYCCIFFMKFIQQDTHDRYIWLVFNIKYYVTWLY